MSKYTPSTEEIRMAWTFDKASEHSEAEALKAFDEFDRWLNEVKADVWDSAMRGETDVEPVNGVWAVIAFEKISHVFLTEIEALRWINEFEYGKVTFLPFGLRLSDVENLKGKARNE